MFITTANLLDPIPSPLRDRMEIINLSGYTEREKIAIARGYLIPRQLQENGLLTGELEFDTPSLEKIIRSYTREAGVRYSGKRNRLDLPQGGHPNRRKRHR